MHPAKHADDSDTKRPAGSRTQNPEPRGHSFFRLADQPYVLSGIRALRLGRDENVSKATAYSQPPEKLAHTRVGPDKRQAKHNQFL